jgi:uncharacterized protein DUF3618
MAQGPDEVIGEQSRTGHNGASTTPLPAPSTDEIRSQIEETRAEMSDTIDAIQNRLSPSRLVAQAKETVTDATVGRVKSLARKASTKAGDFGGQWSYTPADALERMKNNPVPVALVSIAMAGLVLHMIRHRRAVTYARPAGRAQRHASPSTPHPTGAVRNDFPFLAAAGIACWAIWKAQTFASGLHLTPRRLYGSD